MTSRRLSFTFLVALIAPLAACGAPDSNVDNEGQIGEDALPIKGGSLAKAYPEAVLLTMKVNGQTKELCSGSLIAPSVVLTAGHCTHGFTSWDVTAPFANGQKAKATKGSTYDYANESESVNPDQHDVGLVFLDTPITIASYPTIAVSPLADGSTILNVGRINNGELSNSALYVSKPISIQSAKDLGFVYDYRAKIVIEPGDSGGPDFAPNGHTIVAVNSGAGNGVEILARVDLLEPWIQKQIKAHGGNGSGGDGSGGGGGTGGSDGSSSSSGAGGSPGGEPDGPPGWPGFPWCGNIPFQGRCDGNILSFCTNAPHQVDCGYFGRECGFDPFENHFDCL